MSKAMTLMVFLSGISLGIAQQPSVLNEDGTVNSSANRAARGETVQLFLSSACPQHSNRPTQGPAEQKSRPGSSAEGSSAKPVPAQASKDTGRPRVIMNVQAAEVLSTGLSPEFPGMWKITARVPTPNDGEEPLRDQTPYIVLFEGSTESLGALWVEP